MIKKMKKIINSHRKEICQVGLMTVFALVLLPHTCSATDVYTSAYSSGAAMPWTHALDKIAQEITGPIPRFIGLIAIAASGGMLAFGEMGSAAKKVMQIVFGISIALCSATFVAWMGNSTATSGLLF